ncbi:hypothetical protein LX16_4856 [Stackebrandtia albiflava]|uniref:Uncharacterized protein n=1 Tax=Stackebrandtia albiflava TaxID=406432 RepID=A0A562UQ16_9ACTN|nr:hypothetical protein [Stackebrandtia albiflava]TWJ07697.1 hypothetical protein LX16_4856 [Stackebrandtia albiflava]
MVERHSPALLDLATADKLWSSSCHQTMSIDTAPDGPVYRCGLPCGRHTAGADEVRAGLLWHYRGSCVAKTYGLSDEDILGDMFAALHLAWVRNGRIYTARFY